MTKPNILFNKINREDIFVFLDNLRESGLINMMGAGPSITTEFNLNRREARKALLAWINQFEQEDE